MPTTSLLVRPTPTARILTLKTPSALNAVHAAPSAQANSAPAPQANAAPAAQKAPARTPTNPPQTLVPTQPAPAPAAPPSPSAAEINAAAFSQREAIASALYDRSFTFREGIRALTTQQGIAAYAAQAVASGLTQQQLGALADQQAKAQTEIKQLTTNAQGADLNSAAAIEGKELDTVQANLRARIAAGIKDGSLTAKEAKSLLARQDDLDVMETSLRASDGKLTAAEQKQMLDQLRKEADKVERLRRNGEGINLTEKTYADQINQRQAALAKQLDSYTKLGALTTKEVEKIRQSMADANALEAKLSADTRIDWQDNVALSTALNSVEIALYDLSRNDRGKALAASYVDAKPVDGRQAQQLESLARGLSNKSLTDGEGIELLQSQQDVAQMETRFLANDGKFDRAEYLRLANAMNDFALRNHDLQTNAARWRAIV